MQLTIFKPNASNKGGFVTLKISTTKNNKKDIWEKILFAEFVPQSSWDAETKSGKFDASKKRFIALNTSEAGEILNSIEKNIPFQNYHQSGDRSCWVKFAPFEKKRSFGKEGDKGFWEGNVTNFAIGYSEKGGGVNVSLSPGETRAIKILLESYIKESMAIDAKENERKFKEKNAAPKKESKPVKDEVEEMFEDDDEDTPFG